MEIQHIVNNAYHIIPEESDTFNAFDVTISEERDTMLEIRGGVDIPSVRVDVEIDGDDFILWNKPGSPFLDGIENKHFATYQEAIFHALQVISHHVNKARREKYEKQHARRTRRIIVDWLQSNKKEEA